MKTIQTVEEIKNYIRMLLKKIIGVRDTISGRRYSDIIEIAKDQIRKTYMSDEISLNTIAAEVGMSPKLFQFYFQQRDGKDICGISYRDTNGQGKRTFDVFINEDLGNRL